MELYFSIAILLLLVLGLWQRNKKEKALRQDEAADESGEWIERRSGERGTYGMLDRERETARKHIHYQSQIDELALLVRRWFFESYPGYHALEDHRLRGHTQFCKAQLLDFARQLPVLPKAVDPPAMTHTGDPTLCQIIRQFSFQLYPGMLDLDTESLQRLDTRVGLLASDLISFLHA